MPLVNTAIKEAKPRASDYKLTDGGGMYLLVKKNGSKYWRMDYRYLGKRKTLALGVYPSVSLKAAREKRQQAKALLDQQQDPAQVKQQQKQLNQQHPFKEIAYDWWQHQKGTWSDDHAKRVFDRLKNNTFDDLGDCSIHSITPQQIIAVIKKIEQRGSLDVANRIKQAITAIFRFAIQQGIGSHNPASELTGLVKPQKIQHRPSLPREELPTFLQALDTYHERGRLLTQYAIQLLLFTFVRSTELRGAKWQEFNRTDKVWRVPATRMKMNNEHLVPLSNQALTLLDAIKTISGDYCLLFPSEKDREQPMSDNTMRRAIFKLGYDGTIEGKSKAVPHGFRATASSILNEAGFNPDAIERQLGHKETNSVRAAYTHHARYLDERHNMMQWWADYLDQMKISGKAVPLFTNKALSNAKV